MSLARTSLLAALLAGCVAGVSAEELLPGYVRQSVDQGPVGQLSLGPGLAVRAADVAPAAYLAAAAAAGQAEFYNLIDALNALGPIGVSVADYLALALPGPESSRSSSSSGPPAVDASKARSNWLPARLMDPAPLVRANPSAQAAPERARPWALPAAVSDPLTRYLLAAAALAIIAGAGLRLAVLIRRNASPSLPRR